MNRADLIQYKALLEEKTIREHYNAIDAYFPDTGELRRELYPKHLEFFEKGLYFKERLALAANRIGKTQTMGGYEVACHLTGIYPKWWPGVKFDRPIDAWVGGKTSQTVRDIIQEKLLGPRHDHGSGLIRKKNIREVIRRSGISDAIDTVFVNHASGGVSKLGFKSYDQGRQSFEGTKKDLIWLDEECPLNIYIECLLRTTDTSGRDFGNGLMLFTFTPLLGMSEVVLQFMPNGEIQNNESKSKCVITATWDDVPHLSEDAKNKLMASIPPFQRDARSKGVPQLGAGAIYPVSENDYLVDDFAIPDHWPRAYALDVGWNKTACIWGAKDLETDTIYLYSEHYKGEAEPIIHATSIKARGDWIPGVIDPAARGRSQKDGQRLFEQYVSEPLNLNLQMADNSVEAGIYAVWTRLSAGRLKVFKSLSNWRSEIRLYRRDEKGKIVKANDHILDATRYLIMSGIDRAIVKPVKKEKTERRQSPSGWMG
jgi:phage terminase large subunit-like protein